MVCRALLVSAVLLTLCGCGVDTVHVHVELGVCDEQTTFVALRAIEVVLKRNDNAAWLGPCTPALVPPPDIDAFAALLSRTFSFRDVPVGGRWTLAIKGYSEEACGQNSVILCGRTTNVPLPPPSDSVTVNINCLPAFTDLEEYKACIRE